MPCEQDKSEVDYARGPSNRAKLDVDLAVSSSPDVCLFLPRNEVWEARRKDRESDDDDSLGKDGDGERATLSVSHGKTLSIETTAAAAAAAAVVSTVRNGEERSTMTECK